MRKVAMKANRSPVMKLIGILLITSFACSNPLQNLASTPIMGVQPATATLQSPTSMPGLAYSPTFMPSNTPSTTPWLTMTSNAAAVSTPSLKLYNLYMSDEKAGWARALDAEGTPNLLHTMDGGRTWLNVTPRLPNSPIYNHSFFLDAQSAWLLVGAYSLTLARTQDGGETWRIFPLSIVFYDIQFESINDGWGVHTDWHGGSWYMRFYRTVDGGETWTPFSVPQPTSNGIITDPDGFQGCNCGDSLYYDPLRLVLLLSETYADIPASFVHLFMSTDWGKSWRELKLPLPPSQTGVFVESSWPTFVDKLNGLLGVHSAERGTKDSRHDFVAIYVTHDSGLNWKLSMAFENPLHPSDMKIDYATPLDAFVPCGKNLCATHDGAQTWQTLTSNLDFMSTQAGGTLLDYDFVNAATGWAISKAGDGTTLYKTNDGGASWTEIATLIK
jgi:photosystem II stability/assembly factor-like uncharacterized protein